MRYLIFLFNFYWFSIGCVYAAEIKVVTYEWPPYNYREDGKIIGISTEIVRAILNKANIKADYGIYPWARGYEMAKKMKNILIYTIRRIPDREKLFKWIGPIAPPSNSYLYKLKKNKNITIHTLEDAKQYRIGVVNGDSMHQYLLGYGFEDEKNLKLVVRDTQNLRKLFAGRIDLIIWTELTLPIKAKAVGLPYNQLEKVFLLWKDKEGYYLAFSNQTPDELVERVEIAFKQIKNEGVLEFVVEKYMKMFRESEQ